MISMKRSILITTGLLITMFIAACGNSGTGSPNSSGNTSSTSTPVSNGSASVVKTTSATINGKTETILTNVQGMTLYYRTSDTAASVCSGSCAQAWPPLLFTGSGAPVGSSSLAGSLTVSTNANGQQVEYNGHPLYTYAGDTSSGQTNGEGVGGVWFVVPTNLAPSTSTGTTATPTASGYGGYSSHP